MLRSIEATKNGFNSVIDLNDALSHDMANVSTTGYKQTKLIFQNIQEVAVNNIKSDKQYFVNDGSTETIGKLSLGPNTQKSVIDFKQGSIISTGNTFDLALNGDGFFKVQDSKGENFYTRNGCFTIDTQGNMTTIEGYKLLDKQNKPIKINTDGVRYENITVTKQGDIKVKKGKSGAETFEDLSSINIVDFENRGEMKSLGGVMFQPRNNTLNKQITANPDVIQGSVESSNANAVNTMIQSISAMRSYETMVNTMQTASQTLQKAINQTGKPIQ